MKYTKAYFEAKTTLSNTLNMMNIAEQLDDPTHILDQVKKELSKVSSSNVALRKTINIMQKENKGKLEPEEAEEEEFIDISDQVKVHYDPNK
jgi:hypothetical protein